MIQSDIKYVGTYLFTRRDSVFYLGLISPQFFVYFFLNVNVNIFSELGVHTITHPKIGDHAVKVKWIYLSKLRSNSKVLYFYQ